MSQQLTVSSLASAFALVALCMVARGPASIGNEGNDDAAATAPIVAIEAGPKFSG